MTWKIYNEDAIKWANEYDGEPFHALLTDPPYHLTTITKRFGKNGSAPAKFGEDGAFQRASRGFMGQTWDGGDVAFQPETWAAFMKVLYPGAFGMAFSASRNWHRLAVAIEDAGFIIHPSIFGWVQGQGFPKATRVKALGLLEEVWEGHRYGMQALKPAIEPIIVFQKPYEGKPVENIIETGAGALNIDGGRIPLEGGDEYTINTFDDGAKPWGNGAGHKYTSRKIKEDKRLGGKGIWKTDKSAKNVYEGGYAGEEISSSPLGRWPANFILDEVTAVRLDEQSGNLQSGLMKKGTKEARESTGIYGQYNGRETPLDTYADSGGASRFFFQTSGQLDESDPIFYTAKVSPKERNAGLDGVEGTMLPNAGKRTMSGGLDTRGRPETLVRNPHPTVKPISLAKYLATLLLPPTEYAPRRIFVPFSGVASEMIGAGLAGWEDVVGVEFDKENGYVDIANKRLEYWIK